jgi:hypothetical protein
MVPLVYCTRTVIFVFHLLLRRPSYLHRHQPPGQLEPATSPSPVLFLFPFPLFWLWPWAWVLGVQSPKPRPPRLPEREPPVNFF